MLVASGMPVRTPVTDALVDGFARERFRTPVTHAVPLDATLGVAGVLLEPASIVAKAWDQIDRIGRRAGGRPAGYSSLAPVPWGCSRLCSGCRDGLTFTCWIG
jgi:hypothetical protein